MKISNKQISNNGEERLTLSAEDSHASLSALPDKEKERMMTATSGRKCCELYAKFSPLGSLVKTLLESSRWYSPARKLRWDASSLYSVKKTQKEYLLNRNTLSRQCVATLNAKDIASSRLLFRLVPSEHRTEWIEFGLLPTVTAIDAGGGRMNKSLSKGARERPTIALAARMGLLPTPMATEVRHERRVKELKEAGGETFHSRKNGETRPNGIADFLDFHGMLPTPNARDFKNGSKVEDAMTKRKLEQGWTLELNDMAAGGLLPTPRAANYKGSVSPQKIVREDGKIRTDDLKNIPAIIGSHCRQTGGTTSQLSPLFVEEMMGFPSMWIALPFLSQDGDKKQ